jgi:hypothetical protein
VLYPNVKSAAARVAATVKGFILSINGNRIFMGVMAVHGLN